MNTELIRVVSVSHLSQQSIYYLHTLAHIRLHGLIGSVLWSLMTNIWIACHGSLWCLEIIVSEFTQMSVW